MAASDLGYLSRPVPKWVANPWARAGPQESRVWGGGLLSRSNHFTME